MLVPMQDIFGWRDRINVPAQVNDHNWCWRLPWPSSRITSEAEAETRAAELHALSRRYGR
jgi:4-alpha-glucanotransferase